MRLESIPVNEQQIQEQLKQNLPQVSEPADMTMPAPVNTSSGQAEPAVTIDLDEITQYKLHDLFGEQYRPNDAENRQRLAYIYQHVSGMAGTTDYGLVAAKARELERMIGTAYSDNRIYRLYQWLRLDNVRRNLDAEMNSITN